VTSQTPASAERSILDAVMAGNLRQAGRLISRVEAGDTSVAPLIAALEEKRRTTPVVGITGPPGAGKSTLLDGLICHLRASHLRVAVLAVDPSSPFTGGAILGDRIRMGRHAADSGVFIRSMASRASLGGMAVAAGDALTVLAALDFDWIFIETVGVGQNEVEIVDHADTVVVVVTPHSGDAIQAVKAGVLEVGDVYLVNKADTGAAQRTVSALREALHRGAEQARWLPPILSAEAANGVGLDAVLAALRQHRDYLASNPDEFSAREQHRMRIRLERLVLAEVEQRLHRPGPLRDTLDHWLGEAAQKRCSPRVAAAAIINTLGITGE